MKRWDASIRAALFGLAGDSSLTVRKAALDALAGRKLPTAEARRLQELLSHKAGKE
jgi:hypothetical protein